MRVGQVLGFLGTVALCACGSSSGSSSDAASAFAGVWTGSVTTTVGTSSQTRTGVKLPIEELRPNQIKLHGYCSATDIYSDGPTATVTGSGFTVVPMTCSFAGQTCPTITANIQSGNGSLTGGLASTLQVAVTVLVTDCAGTGTDLLTYTASQKAPYGSTVLVAPGESD